MWALVSPGHPVTLSATSSGWAEEERSTAHFKPCPLSNVSSAVCCGNWMVSTRQDVSEVCLPAGSGSPWPGLVLRTAAGAAYWEPPGRCLVGRRRGKPIQGQACTRERERLGGAHRSQRLCGTVETSSGQQVILLPCVGGQGFRVQE